jgi:hypothetical protein
MSCSCWREDGLGKKDKGLAALFSKVILTNQIPGQLFIILSDISVEAAFSYYTHGTR